MLLLAGMAGGSPAPYDWTPPICRFAWGSLQALPTPRGACKPFPHLHRLALGNLLQAGAWQLGFWVRYI